jgi:hypothetical protein
MSAIIWAAMAVMAVMSAKIVKVLMVIIASLRFTGERRNNINGLYERESSFSCGDNAGPNEST